MKKLNLEELKTLPLNSAFCCTILPGLIYVTGIDSEKRVHFNPNPVKDWCEHGLHEYECLCRWGIFDVNFIEDYLLIESEEELTLATLGMKCNEKN